MKKVCWLVPCITVFVSWLGGFFTQKGMAWYHTLILSSLTPPSWVFGVVWTCIFTLATVSFLLFCAHAERNQAFYSTAIIFAVNAVVNVAWSFFFFYLQHPFLALCDACILTATVCMLVHRLWYKERYAAWCLVPYMVWSFFALYLNAMVVYLN